MKSIAVIFGGKSAEHDVSIITAHIPIINTLLSTGEFDVWPIYITKEGRWYCDKRMNDLRFFKEPDWEAQMASWKPIELSFDGGFQICWPRMFGKCAKIDVVFPAMHGTYGEDGSLMGLLRMANVPFVGCDLFASAVAMDKVLTKQVIEAGKIPTPPYVWFTRAMWKHDAAKFRHEMKKLKWPVFVKPVHLGSSIGISKASSEKEFENAIEVALHYDDKVLVEQGVPNLIEVTLPIMGNEEPRTANVERALNKTELFDFNEKYLSGRGKGGGVNSEYSEIPANIGEKLTSEVKEMGLKVYQMLGCTGISRVDFLIDKEVGEAYVIEVNPLPGSLYHHNWKKAGVSNRDLVLGLVQLAEERFASQQKNTYAFKSDILKKVAGPKVQP